MKNHAHALVVDDHKSVCEGIAALVERTGLIEKVFTAFTGESALEIFKTQWIHIAIIDARMRGMSGIELIKNVHKLFPKIKVIAITSYEEKDTLKEIWSAQVNGILLKRSTDAQEIKSAIQEVLNGQAYLSPEVSALIDKSDFLANAKTKLSLREHEILLGICGGRSTKEIASDQKLSVNTIEDYRKEMLHKTKTKNSAELVAYAHRNGLV